MSLNRAKRRKNLLVLLLAAVFILGALPAFASAQVEAAGGAFGPLHIQSEPVPQRITDVAFRKFSYSSLVDYELWGYPEEQARRLKLAPGFYAYNLDGSVRSDQAYFPILDGEKLVGLLIASDTVYEGGGHDVLQDADLLGGLNSLKTTAEHPARIIVSKNPFPYYSVTDAGAAVLSARSAPQNQLDEEIWLLSHQKGRGAAGGSLPIIVTIGGETAIASASFPPAAELAADPKSCYTINSSIGVVFPSVEKLRRYLSFLSADPSVSVWTDEREKDELAFMLNLNTLYLPEGFADKIDQISSIMIRPISFRVTFDCDGVLYHLDYFYGPSAYKGDLSYAKFNTENGSRFGSHEKVKGRDVYSYFFGEYRSKHEYGMAYHSWEQDGKYFTLEVNEKGADPNKRYFELCDARAYPLFDPPPTSGFYRVNGALCYKNADGSSPKGWTEIGGKTYYFRADGEALTKNTTIGGIRCKFNSEGHFLGRYTGWLKKTDAYLLSTYCYYKNGELQTGWFTQNGKTYYLHESGIRAVGMLELDGTVYLFGYDGVLLD